MWRLNELFGVAQAHPAERLGCLALGISTPVIAGTPRAAGSNRVLANAFFAGRDDLDAAPMEHGITAFPRLPAAASTR